MSIQGFLPPHGGRRGIHYETFPLGDDLRFRVFVVDLAFVAWEFVLTEHIPVQRPNQAMRLTASKLTIYRGGFCHWASRLRASRAGSPQLILGLIRSCPILKRYPSCRGLPSAYERAQDH